MSKCKSELTLKEREILQYIIYATRNPKHETFFGSNEYLAKCVDAQPDTARKAVKKLLNLGYLALNTSKPGRHVVYTGKEFVPIVFDMRNIDKKVLKQDRDNFKRDAEYYQNELRGAKLRITGLEQEIYRLNQKLMAAESRIMRFEKMFQDQGYSKAQIDALIASIKFE